MPPPPPPPPPRSAAAHYGLAGRAALVTGGTKGIGAASVLELAGLGCRVLFCARTEADVSAREAEWRHMGHDVRGLAADVASREGVAAIVAAAAAFCANGDNGKGGGGKEDCAPTAPTPTCPPRLDVLVLNAGTNVQLPTVDYELPRHYDEIVGTNLGAPIALAQALHPLLAAPAAASREAAEAGGGGGGGPDAAAAEAAGQGRDADADEDASSVVLVSSVAGGPLAGRSGLLYGASKAGLNHVARLLAAEWGGGARQEAAAVADAGAAAAATAAAGAAPAAHAAAAAAAAAPPAPCPRAAARPPARRIRVNAVAPWVTLTDLGLQNLAADPSAARRLLERTPLGRLARPADVSAAVAFLASPRLAGYVTGQVLAVDGGYSVKGYW